MYNSATKKTYRLLYILIFTGLGVFSYFLLANYANLPVQVSQALSFFGGYAFFAIAFNIVGFTILYLSNWIQESYTLYLSKWWRITLLWLVVCFLLFVINYGLLVSAKLMVGVQEPFIFPNGGHRILLLVWFVELIVMGFLLSNTSMSKALLLQQKTAELEKETNNARYIALQNQLNPHFLFNSLNTLIAEIEYNPRNAIEFTRCLSDVYRYVLKNQQMTMTSLKEELNFMQAYIFLHKVRLGDCITIDYNIPDVCYEYQLPPLTLQLLIENVIKHNVITEKKPMHIELCVEDKMLQVTNTLRPKKIKQTSGIGLKNLSNRYLLIMNKYPEICVSEDYFRIKVPLLYEE